MSKIEKISVAITAEQHAKIKAAVERGDYATTSEVIRTALREWELKEEMRRLEGIGDHIAESRECATVHRTAYTEIRCAWPKPDDRARASRAPG